ncbi:MAG: hypothetical protein MJ252_29975, partial [archaeon]|nr:hypothetical protein [archaeon]
MNIKYSSPKRNNKKIKKNNLSVANTNYIFKIKSFVQSFTSIDELFLQIKEDEYKNQILIDNKKES